LLDSFHPVVGASAITYMSLLIYPFTFWVVAEQKGNEVGGLLYHRPSSLFVYYSFIWNGMSERRPN